MPNVYAILGEANARKSSTVRALTGVTMQYNPWTVATTPPTGNIDIYVEIRALQELNIQPQEFVDKIAGLDRLFIKQGHTVNNILIPLRISAFNGCPDGAAYLQHFASVGWNIRPSVVLGTAALPIGLPARVPAHLIPGSASMPANQIASNIRSWWHWL